MSSILDTIFPSGENGTALFAAVFFVALFIFFVVMAISDIMQRRADIKKRTQVDRVFQQTDGNTEWEDTSRSLRFQSTAANASLLADVERSQKNAGAETDETKLHRELIRAGYFGKNSVGWFQAIRATFALGLPIIGYATVTILNYDLEARSHFTLAMMLLGAGYFIPNVYLRRRQRTLLKQSRDGFPDFMDLMVICAEAGLSPRAAIDRISREIAHSYPYLGANIYLMSLELRAGGALSTAIGNLARRIDLEEVVALGSLMQQTEQLGTSISDALRVYSDEMRDKRLARAEERAYALPVKLTLPLGLYVFPVMLVVIGLPVFIRVKHALL